MTPKEEYLTVSQARALMGVTKFKMTKLLKTGEIASQQSLRDARVTLVKRSDVEAWIERAGPPLPKREPEKEVRPVAA